MFILFSCYFTVFLILIVFICFFFHFFYFSRKKRALSDWLIVPHTKWCGRGQTADNYSQLGGASKADKCCRRHDHCKFNIYAMTTKWRLFNYRPFTISHCSCDMRLDIHLRYIENRFDLKNFYELPTTTSLKTLTLKMYQLVANFKFRLVKNFNNQSLKLRK